eukprot:TRINITY_DN50369_c0_g1_i1.p1 TRINITY_DN50369_c0_g1~~TRINITY_DN50369_c0_g1_i1.p1  ORF type:complete len:417 (+),score=142.56 TRINITY_DN50369_c0_g1_i1:55-1251(+)
MELRASAALRRLSFAPQRDGLELAALPKLGGGTRQLWRLRGAAAGATAGVRRGVRAGPWSVEEDSVDLLPAFERRVAQRGEWSDDAADLRRWLEPVVQESLLPAVRSLLGAPRAALDAVICRRYAAGERRGHPPHFDGHAMATAVIDASAGPGAYEGGLFAQCGPRAEQREFAVMADGDAVLHGSDLEHGVAVSSGSRLSIIAWFRDSPESVQQQASPWYATRAHGGDADAQLMLGLQRAEDGDPAAAEQWLRTAAAAGHHAAQMHLGALLLRQGRFGAGEEQLGLSAAQGYAPSQRHLAVVRGTATDEGRELLRQAAEQGCAKSLLLLYDASPGDPRRSEWLQRAAESGLPLAQRLMAAAGAAEGRPAEAALWLRRAARQGDPQAARALAAATRAPA